MFKSLIFHKCVRTYPYLNVLLFNYSSVTQNLHKLQIPKWAWLYLHSSSLLDTEINRTSVKHFPNVLHIWILTSIIPLAKIHIYSI